MDVTFTNDVNQGFNYQFYDFNCNRNIKRGDFSFKRSLKLAHISRFQLKVNRPHFVLPFLQVFSPTFPLSLQQIPCLLAFSIIFKIADSYFNDFNLLFIFFLRFYMSSLCFKYYRQILSEFQSFKLL